MSKKKPLIILTVMILGVVIFFCIKSRTNGNYEPVTERADVFPGIEEFVSLSDKIGAYVENVSYMVKDIKWDEDGKNGTAEVLFRSPDLYALILEGISKSESNEDVVSFIKKSLDEKQFVLKERTIKMAAVKEDGIVKLIPNDDMLEILNGSTDEILMDLIVGGENEK